MILEGLVTTLDERGDVNIAPMGPSVEPDMRRLLLRPFPTSATYRNLRRSGEGVFHVSDDAELLARAAVGDVSPPPPMFPAEKVRGMVLAGACRWYAFRAAGFDDSRQRIHIDCEVVASGRLREFFGFNRAKHAVLEAAILATRAHLLPREEILAELDRLRPLVEKTGGEAERRAFDFLAESVFVR